MFAKKEKQQLSSFDDYAYASQNWICICTNIDIEHSFFENFANY